MDRANYVASLQETLLEAAEDHAELLLKPKILKHDHVLEGHSQNLELNAIKDLWHNMEGR